MNMSFAKIIGPCKLDITCHQYLKDGHQTMLTANMVIFGNLVDGLLSTTFITYPFTTWWLLVPENIDSSSHTKPPWAQQI